MTDMTKAVETRDGRKVRLLGESYDPDYPVQGEIQQNNGSWAGEKWTRDGKYLHSAHDLINPKTTNGE